MRKLLALFLCLLIAGLVVPFLPVLAGVDQEALLITTTGEDWPAYRTCGNRGVCALSDETFWSVFIADDALASPGVAAIHYDITGTVLATENVASTAIVETWPSIAVDSQDNLHVVYFDDTNGNAYYRRRDAATNLWDAAILLSDPNDCWNQGVSIAVDSQDDIHVVWGEDSSDGLADDAIYYGVSTDGGATFSAGVRISPLFTDAAWDADYWPVIAVDANDYLHVAWEGYGRGPVNFNVYQIHYIQYNSDNADWWGYYEVTQDDVLDMYDPGIAVDLDGVVHLYWYDPGYWYSTHCVVYVTRSAAGVWSGTTDAAAASGNDLLPRSISLSSAGDIFILGSDGTDISCLTYNTPTWDCEDNVEGNPLLGDDDGHTSALWAMWPEFYGVRSNYPGTGYFLHYSRDLGADGELRFLADDFAFGSSTSPLEDFIATPRGCDRIDLYWYDPNADTDNVTTIVRGRAGAYPTTPPSLLDGSYLVYSDGLELGDHTVSNVGLKAGTTYYYRIWRYDIATSTYTLDGQDFVTTYACEQGETTDVPSGWYQEPSCDMYYNTFLWPAMNYAVTQYQVPEAYFCMIVTFFLIFICCVSSFPVAMVASSNSPKSMAVPFFIAMALIAAAASAGAIPLGVTIVSCIAIGGVGVFVWNRT